MLVNLTSIFFIFKSNRKDTLKSFRINLANQLKRRNQDVLHLAYQKALDVLDLSITFNEFCLTKEKYKGQLCNIYHGKLTYAVKECIQCKNDVVSDLVHWGRQPCDY